MRRFGTAPRVHRPQAPTLDILRLMDTSLSDLAQLVTEDFWRGRESEVDASRAHELRRAIELALLTAARAERRACIAECSRRADLWEQAEKRNAALPAPRVEAQCRANEARYLADLLQTRGPVT
jgi:hypothetical protein